MPKIDTPKLAYPFDIADTAPRANYTEQGSQDEMTDRLEVLLSTEIGERPEVPEYGLPDQAFRQGGADMDVIMATIERWEPDIAVAIERSDLADMIDTIRIEIRGGS